MKCVYLQNGSKTMAKIKDNNDGDLCVTLLSREDGWKCISVWKTTTNDISTAAVNICNNYTARVTTTSNYLGISTVAYRTRIGLNTVQRHTIYCARENFLLRWTTTLTFFLRYFNCIYPQFLK